MYWRSFCFQQLQVKKLIQNRDMTTKYKMMRTFAGLAAGAGVFGLMGGVAAKANPIGPVTPNPYGSVGTMISTANGLGIFAGGGAVNVTFLGADAADLDITLLSAPTTTGTLINNQTSTGSPVPVGTFTGGQELVFELQNIATGLNFFSGVNNLGLSADGDVHAFVEYNYLGISGDTYVGFEDLTTAEGSDWDYNDLEFLVTGTEAPPTIGSHSSPTPDASSTLPLLGMSLAGLAALTRRFKK
jgi:hypothetical protein